MMTELAVRNVEDNSILDLRPVGVARQKNKLGLCVDKISDQPGTSDSIDLDILARDPFHKVSGGEIKLRSNVRGPRFSVNHRRGNGVFNGDAGAVEDDNFRIVNATGLFAGNDLR